MEPYEKSFIVGWGDMDFNAHMRNTSYLDRCGDIRMMYFAEHGFSTREFEKFRFGPLIMRDELEYFKESRLLDELRVTLAVCGLSTDGARFKLRNEFFRDGKKLAARVTSVGGWLDLDKRRLVPPPHQLVTLMERMPRTSDFEELGTYR